jgi:hypothetical protein
MVALMVEMKVALKVDQLEFELQLFDFDTEIIMT